MVELCLMASAAYPARIFHQEQRFSTFSKDLQPFLPSQFTRPMNLGSGHLQLRLPQLEDSWKSMHLLPESTQSARHFSNAKSPVLFNVQDARPDSVLLSFGIAEQYARREKILQFLMSGQSISEREKVNFSLLSDLMGLHTLAFDMNQLAIPPTNDELFLDDIVFDESQPSMIYPRSEAFFQKPILDFLASLSPSSAIMVHSDGRVLVTGTRAEVKDLLSVITEFNLAKNSINSSRQSVLVPPFARWNCGRAKSNVSGSSSKLKAVTTAPVKSPEKLKKKHGRKAGTERDLYRKNYFHACESLLSVLLDKRPGKSKILSLKTCGPELPQLLTNFSAGIAGTGLAVVFSIFCKVGVGRMPFCATKLLNIGFGLGLVWLSWAVNRLRDTIVCITKNSSKRMNEDEITRKVNKSVNEIFFRAATVMAVAVLGFA